MTRRVKTGHEEATDYDGPVEEQELELDFDMGEIIRPSNKVYVVTPDGPPAEAVTTDIEAAKAKQERRKQAAAAAAAKEAQKLQEEKVAQARLKSKKKVVKKKTISKPKE